MPISIAKLGNSLRCPREDCDNFGKILSQKITQDTITINMVCEKHNKKYSRKYSLNQYIRMANAGLIDKEWIEDFQKKMIILTGRFIKIDGGMEGAFVVKNLNKIKTLGRKIICKCGNISHVTFVKIKKDKTQVNLYCPVCMPKGKKVWFKTAEVIEMAKAGLIDHLVYEKIKAAYEEDNEVFNVEESWGGMQTQMASWVQEDLGMIGDDGGIKRCYFCGAVVSEGMDRCPKCGMDL